MKLIQNRFKLIDNQPIINAVFPLLFLALISAPLSSKNFTISKSVLRQVCIKGVLPPLSATLISAPFSINNSAISVWHLIKASK